MCYKEFKNFFNSIYEFSSDEDLEIYLVGGFLRDWFINNEFCSNDVDFAVKGDARNLVNKFIKEYGGKVTEFKSFLTSKISDIPSLNIINQIDFAGLRKEVYEKDGAFPKVESTEDILEDLKRRDYSINTLAIKLKDFLKSFNDDTKNLDKGLLSKFIINSQKGLEDLEKPTYLLPEDYDYLMSNLLDLLNSGELIKDRTALSPENYGFDIYATNIRELWKGPDIIGRVRFISGTSWLFKFIVKRKYKL